jgi:hypothetical protein
MCVSETQEQTNSQTEVEEAGNRQEGGAMRSQERGESSHSRWRWELSEERDQEWMSQSAE